VAGLDTVTEPNVRPTPRLPWLLLLLILVFNVWLRAHTFAPTLHARFGLSLWPVMGAASEPLDCDESAYAYIGRRINDGAVMYRDLSENKPPGGYWLYALAEAIGGANELTIRLMPLPLVLATIVVVWWLGLRLGGPIAATLGALLFCILNIDPYVYGNGSDFEHAINLFSVASLALVLRASSSERGGTTLLVLAGASLGIACLFKQVVLLNGPLLGGYLLLSGKPWKTRIRELAALGLGVALVWLGSALLLVVQGAGPAAFNDIFRYGRALATDTLPEPNAPSFWIRWLVGNADPGGNLPPPFGRTDYLVWWGTGAWPVWLAGVSAMVSLTCSRTSNPERKLLVFWTLSAFVQVVLPGLYWAHYYMLPLPGLSVLVAVCFADKLGRLCRGGVSTVFASVWLLGLTSALLWTGWIQTRDYLLTEPVMLTIKYKGGGQWVVLRDLGRELARRQGLWKSPKLFVWGWQSPLFFYSGLDGVSRHFFVDNLLRDHASSNHPLIRPRIERIMRDLRANPPALIFVGYPPFPELDAYLRERYLPSRIIGSETQGYPVWVERDKFVEFEAYGPMLIGP